MRGPRDTDIHICAEATDVAAALKTDAIKSAIEASPAIDTGGYIYKVLPFGENGTEMSSGLIAEVSQGLFALAAQFRSQFKYICAVAPGGHGWGLLLAREFRCDLAVLRQTFVSRSEQVSCPSTVGRNAFAPEQVPKMIRHQPVILVDDVISTGTTMVQILEELKLHRVSVVAIISIYSRGPGRERLMRQTGIPVECILAE